MADRELAQRLLFEAGLCPEIAHQVDTEVIEMLAGEGMLGSLVPGPPLSRRWLRVQHLVPDEHVTMYNVRPPSRKMRVFDRHGRTIQYGQSSPGMPIRVPTHICINHGDLRQAYITLNEWMMHCVEQVSWREATMVATIRISPVQTMKQRQDTLYEWAIGFSVWEGTYWLREPGQTLVERFPWEM